MLVAGSMIGSCIFIVPAGDGAATSAASGWLLASWIITGILTLTAALSYGELAGDDARAPRAQSHLGLREAFSPMWGFLYGWTLFGVIQTACTIAAVGVAFLRVIWACCGRSSRRIVT